MNSNVQVIFPSQYNRSFSQSHAALHTVDSSSGDTWVMVVNPNSPCAAQHTMLRDRWLPNMLHISHPHMLYSWALPYSRERCTSQQECLSLSADLPGWRSRSITSYNINLGKALCQLKVEGAIIWARAELASHWPSTRCRLQQRRYNVELLHSAGQTHASNTHQFRERDEDSPTNMKKVC